MCNLADDKFKAASALEVVPRFCFRDLVEMLGESFSKDAIYAVLGELLELGVLEVQRANIAAPDGFSFTTYVRAAGTEAALEHYITELNEARTQPDPDGKPRGLSFRLAESLIKSAISTSDRLSDEQRRSLFHSIEQYLSLAQQEETGQRDISKPQDLLSEAHLRLLYGKYLYLASPSMWSSAIAQLLISARIFSQADHPDQSSATEAEACLMLREQYRGRYQQSEKSELGSLLDFAETVERVFRSATRAGCMLTLFASSVREILDDTRLRIDHLSIHAGDFITVVRRAWSLPQIGSTPKLEQAFRLLGDARLAMMSGQTLAARITAEKALVQLGAIDPGNEEVRAAVWDVNRHLLALQAQAMLDGIMRSVQRGDRRSASETLTEFSALNFEGVVPFYIALVLEKSKSVLRVLLEHENLRPIDQTGVASSPVFDERDRRSRLQAQSQGDLDYREWMNWGSKPSNSLQSHANIGSFVGPMLSIPLMTGVQPEISIAPEWITAIANESGESKGVEPKGVPDTIGSPANRLIDGGSMAVPIVTSLRDTNSDGGPVFTEFTANLHRLA